MTDVLEEEEISTLTTQSEGQPREGTVGRWPSASQGERPQEGPKPGDTVISGS